MNKSKHIPTWSMRYGTIMEKTTKGNGNIYFKPLDLNKPANIRLINSAPELLIALKETLSCIDQHTDDPVLGPIIQYARTIIAKATGGAE